MGLAADVFLIQNLLFFLSSRVRKMQGDVVFCPRQQLILRLMSGYQIDRPLYF